MGPQLYRCGNVKGNDTQTTRSICFNGAATLSLRKHLPHRTNQHTACSLQWGRNFIVAETWNIAVKYLPFAVLQWGRNFIVAETHNER